VKSAERRAGSLSLCRTPLTRPLPMLATDFAKCSFCPSLFFVSLGFDPVLIGHRYRQCNQYEAKNAGKQIHTIVEESAETSVDEKDGVNNSAFYLMRRGFFLSSCLSGTLNTTLMLVESCCEVMAISEKCLVLTASV